LHSSIQIIKKLIESLKLNKISFVLIAAIVMTMAQSSSAWAVNVQKFRPTTGHVEGMQVFTSETLPKYYFAFGVSGNYANHPLEQTPAGSTARLAGIVDQLVTMDALMTYGLMDWLTISETGSKVLVISSSFSDCWKRPVQSKSSAYHL